MIQNSVIPFDLFQKRNNIHSPPCFQKAFLEYGILYYAKIGSRKQIHCPTNKQMNGTLRMRTRSALIRRHRLPSIPPCLNGHWEFNEAIAGFTSNVLLSVSVRALTL